MGSAPSRHAEVRSGAPSAQARSGLLMVWSGDASARPSVAWAQRFGVLAARKLHLFANEREALAWGTPLLVVDLAHCIVRPQEASYQGATFPPGTLVIETPTTPARMEVQGGLSSIHLRVFGGGDAPDPAGGNSAEVWLSQLRQASREPWMSDSEALGCPRCGNLFDILNRRHHCRRCGATVCEPCSAYAKPLPDLDYPEPVRVCRKCHVDNGPVPEPAESAARAQVEAAVAEDLRYAARSGKREAVDDAATVRRPTTQRGGSWMPRWPNYGLDQKAN